MNADIHFTSVGDPIPPGDHSVVVYTPTWGSAISIRRQEPDTIARIQTGYPRFFMPLVVRKLARQLEQHFAQDSEQSVLLRSGLAAEACRAFLVDRAGVQAQTKALQPLEDRPDSHVFMVIFPSDAMPVALEFWQHTGFGISSRFAERYLVFLDNLEAPQAALADTPRLIMQNSIDVIGDKHDPKAIMKARIAKLITHNVECSVHRGPKSSMLSVNSEDVFLYPTGVTAMWTAHQLLMGTRVQRKSVCFGFLYIDTVKILEKWGPGCHFYAAGNEADLESLTAMLESERAKSPSEPPILALFTEAPSNPLLRSVDLPRLRALADEYGFAIVLDDTVGNFVNVDVLPHVDIVISSLSKIFSGRADTLGGSLVLNPVRKYYSTLKGALERTWEDIYFEPDAAVMELNSRTFCERIAQIDTNAEAVCDFLRTRTTVISRVCYPKLETRALYDATRSTFADGSRGGFGGLLSVFFRAPCAAHAFYDALRCAKGPSFGTNFTLAFPYVVVAYYGEQEWADSHGVSADMVRISFGTEDTEQLLDMVAVALRAAEQAFASGSYESVIDAIKPVKSC